MGIKFTESTIGVWFVALGDSDWFASIFRDDDGVVSLSYRFRHYKDGRSFDSKDVKTWYSVKELSRHEGPERLVETTRRLAAVMTIASEVTEEPWELMMEDCEDLAVFIREFQAAPFVEVKEVP